MKFDVTSVASDFGPLAETRSILLANETASASIFLETDADATTANGYEWKPADGPISIDLPAYERLSMISGGVTQTVRALRVGR